MSTDWTDDIPEVTPDAERDFAISKLLRLLAREPGSSEEKRRFMEREWSALEVEAQRLVDQGKVKSRGRAMVDATVRFWRWRLRHGDGVRKTAAEVRHERSRAAARAVLVQMHPEVARRGRK